MLKQTLKELRHEGFTQPPLGGCVLKLYCEIMDRSMFHQPPLGGCVLKQLFAAEKHGQ